jgi:symplekin
MPAVQDFLQRAVGRGGDWCTLGLLAARDVILMRPPSRTPLLQLVLDSCCAAASDTRSKAVRLVANRLFPEAGMAQQIEHTARQRLDALLPAMPAEAALRGQAPAGGATETKIEAAEEAFTAASAHESSDGQRLQHDSEQHEQQKQDATLQSSQPQQLQPSELQQQAEHAAATEAEGEPPSETDGPSDVEAAQLCALYCALCTKKHSLLRRLFEVYGQTSGKAAAPALRLPSSAAMTCKQMICR